VLSYVPLNVKPKMLKHLLEYEETDYKDRIESQEELKNVLDCCFEKTKKMDLNTFKSIVENQNSDICLYILIFLLEKKPIMLSTLVPHEQGKKVCKSPEIANVPKIIKSPNLFSKFSPVVAIIKSPTIQNKKLLLEDDKGNPS